MRQAPTQDGGDPIDIIVDFLMPRDAQIAKNVPPLIGDFAVHGRYKQKDAYDIYYCVRNYPGGPEALAERSAN